MRLVTVVNDKFRVCGALTSLFTNLIALEKSCIAACNNSAGEEPGNA